MPTYSIQGPDGKTYSIDGPEGATRDQVIAQIQKRQAADPDRALPFQDPPGFERSTFFPTGRQLGEKRQSERGETTYPLATPGMITGPLRAIVKGGQVASGKRSVETLSESDLIDMASLGAGGAVAARSARGAITEIPEAAAEIEGTKGKPLGKAAAEVVKRLKEGEKAGGPTAQDIISEHYKAPDKPLTLTDLGPESVRSLAGRVYRSGAEARNIIKQAFDARDLTAGRDLGRDVSKYFGTGSVHQTATKLLQERSAAARPQYAQMEALQNIWSPRLQEFLDSPEVQKAMGLGFKLERMDALAEGRAFDPTQMGVELDAEGNVKILKVPNMRVLDIGKQGLDAVIAEERDPITGRLSKTGRSYQKVREAYVNELDALDKSGTYKAARDAWAGPSKSLDALRAGRTVFNRSPEEIAEDFNKLSDADKQFFRLGVADMIVERIEKTGISSDESLAIIRNQRNRAQLRPLFKSDAEFDKFANQVDAFRKMFNSRRAVMGGSQTAERLQEDLHPGMEAAAHGARAALNIARGNPVEAGLNALRAWRAGQAIQNPEVSADVARLLSTPLNAENSEALQLLMDYSLGLPSTQKVVRPNATQAP